MLLLAFVQGVKRWNAKSKKGVFQQCPKRRARKTISAFGRPPTRIRRSFFQLSHCDVAIDAFSRIDSVKTLRAVGFTRH